MGFEGRGSGRDPYLPALKILRNVTMAPDFYLTPDKDHAALVIIDT